MPLSKLNWRKLPEQNVGAYVVNDLLDAAYDAFNSSTYYDGTSRTQGVGSAVTVSRDQPGGTTEAVYWTHAGGDPAIKGIIAGRNGAAASAPINLVDTYQSNGLHMGLFEDAGAYNNWDDANPFTTGSNTGFVRFCDAGLTAPLTLACYECEEAVAVQLIRNNGVDPCFLQIQGNICDPESDQFADTRDDTYPGITGILTTNATTGMATNIMSSTGVTMLNSSIVSNGSAKARLRNKRFAAYNSRRLSVAHDISALARYMYLQSGRPVFVPVFQHAGGTTRELIGRLREIHFAPPGQGNAIIESGGVTAAYILAPEEDASRERIALRY